MSFEIYFDEFSSIDSELDESFNDLEDNDDSEELEEIEDVLHKMSPEMRKIKAYAKTRTAREAIEEYEMLLDEYGWEKGDFSGVKD